MKKITLRATEGCPGVCQEARRRTFPGQGAVWIKARRGVERQGPCVPSASPGLGHWRRHCCKGATSEQRGQTQVGHNPKGRQGAFKGYKDGMEAWEHSGVIVGDTHGRNCCFSRLGAGAPGPGRQLQSFPEIHRGHGLGLRTDRGCGYS